MPPSYISRVPASGSVQHGPAEAESGGDHGAARTDAVEPAAEQRRGDAEEGDGDGEDPAETLDVQSSGAEAVPPIRRVSGRLNTLNA